MGDEPCRPMVLEHKHLSVPVRRVVVCLLVRRQLDHIKNPVLGTSIQLLRVNLSIPSEKTTNNGCNCLTLTHLKLTQDVDQDAAVKGRLAVDGGDEMGDFLERQRGNLLHDFGGSLN